MNYEELLMEYKNEEALLKSSLEFKKAQKESLVEDVEKIENMFRQGLMGVEEYAQLKRNFLGGIPEKELIEHYDRLIKEDAKKLFELKEKINKIEKRIELRDKVFKHVS